MGHLSSWPVIPVRRGGGINLRSFVTHGPNISSLSCQRRLASRQVFESRIQQTCHLSISTGLGVSRSFYSMYSAKERIPTRRPGPQRAHRRTMGHPGMNQPSSPGPLWSWGCIDRKQKKAATFGCLYKVSEINPISYCFPSFFLSSPVVGCKGEAVVWAPEEVLRVTLLCEPPARGGSLPISTGIV